MGGTPTRWVTALCALFAVAAGVAAGLGVPDAQKWGNLSGSAGVAAFGCWLGVLRRRVEAGPDGLRIRAVLGWRRLGWDEIVRLEAVRRAADAGTRSGPQLRVTATLRDGSLVWLPVPYVGAVDTEVFEKELAQLRAVRRRYTRGTRKV